MLTIFSGILSIAQSPATISYQAIIRDNSGAPIVESDVTLSFSILKGSTSGSVVFSENHNAHTNYFGLVNIQIGSLQSGLGTIDWAAGPYFLKIVVDTKEVGTTQLISVPYALYALKAGNGFSGVYNDLTGKPDLSIYLQNETDPLYNASVARTITATNVSGWNSAYAWGNHASAGYLKSESDPVFNSSAAQNITATNITNWTSAYGWGNHASAGYLKSESDPVFNLSAAKNISATNITNWTSAYGWGNHASAGYLKTETDPIYNVSAAKTITSSDITNWNSVKWVRSADSLYYVQGNVGIGTKDPRSTLSVSGTTPNDSAIFEVKNNNGLTVFAVYNEGVRIYVDETAKAAKGGFAVGGFSSVKGVTRDYMRITGDSIRMYIDNTTPAKGAKGGFAIGGFDKAKAGYSRYMNISGDEGVNAGFNSFIGYKSGNPTAGGTHNIGIGYYSGATLSTGRNNIFIGDSAGLSTTFGYENIFIGRNSGAKMFAGYNNVYIGYRTGSEGHGQYNVFIGDQAGRYNNNGWSNVFVGNSAGSGVTSGYQNTFMGTQSGWKIGTGNENTFIGSSTGFNALNSSGNTFVGSSAGNFNVSGNNNVYIGLNAGLQATGTGNIFIGANAGSGVTLGNSQLIIDNTSSTATTAFIGGDLLGDKLRFNCDVTVRSAPQTGYAFYVNGTAGGTAAWASPSDARLKTNIHTISNPLEKVLALRGVSFEWNDPSKFSPGPQIGFIAQETMNVLPEIVNRNGEYYSMQYAPVTALLVEAIRELKKENDQLKEKMNKLDDLELQIEALKSLVNSMQNK